MEELKAGEEIDQALMQQALEQVRHYNHFSIGEIVNKLLNRHA